MNQSHSKRKGHKKLPLSSKRSHTISVRVTPSELEWIDSMRQSMQMHRGEYSRWATLKNLPPIVPTINREAWIRLGQLGNSFNQFQRSVNEGIIHNCPAELLAEVDEMRELLVSIRTELLGSAEMKAAPELKV